MDVTAKIYVAGHNGLVGSSLCRKLKTLGARHILTRGSKELDLRDQRAVRAFFFAERPDYVFLAAAKVGGILANDRYPADFINDNLLIQCNVIDAAHTSGCKKLLFLGSSCIYPRLSPQPIKEEYLLTGPLEQTNDAYAIAKIAGITMCQAYRRQYGFDAISAMPTNLYGPGDNFDAENSHVIPGLIRRIHTAKQECTDTVTIWGSGTPRREFLYVDDLADALVFLMQHYSGPDPVNVGCGHDVSIAELAALIAKTIGYTGTLVYDRTKPDGTPQKLLDVGKLNALGWRHSMELADGLALAYAWYREHA